MRAKFVGIAIFVASIASAYGQTAASGYGLWNNSSKPTLLASSYSGETRPQPSFSPLDIYGKVIENRLGLGLRLTTFRLRDTTRPPDVDNIETFVGFVNKLNEKDEVAFWPVLTYSANDYLSFEFSWGEVAAETMNFNNSLSDGVIRMDGPLLGVNLHYPVYGYLYPYLGVAYAPWRGSFDHEDWWRLGWSTPEAYKEAGSPKNQKGDKKPRLMAVGNDSGMALTLGLRLQLHRHVDLDFQVRRLSMKSKVSYYRGRYLELMEEGSFSLDHTLVGAGVIWVF